MCLATSSTQNTSNTTTSTTATITSTTSTPPTPTVLETARWADLGEAAKIDKLNAMARKRSSENTLAPSDPDWMMHELVRQGKPVFKHRSMALLYLYWGLTAYGLLTAPSLAFALGAFLVSYLYIEAYGAVLHVNLDNPAFLHLPVLWEACLEFQFHHVIPNEICLRSYRQIAADLNVIVGLHFVVAALLFAPVGGLGNPYVRTFVACGMVNAYLLEWAHRQAHFTSSKRHPLAQRLQDWGLLVSESLHRQHHQTFDAGFPVLSGLSDPLINYLHAKVTNQWVWLAAFVGLTLGGVPLLAWGYLAVWEKGFGMAVW